MQQIRLQDNAQCHKARDVLDFLKENDVAVMQLPPRSLDLKICGMTLKQISHTVIFGEDYGNEVQIDFRV